MAQYEERRRTGIRLAALQYLVAAMFTALAVSFWVLQVVENPGWLLPYLSCVLVAAGLLLHFAMRLRRSLGGRTALAGALT